MTSVRGEPRPVESLAFALRAVARHAGVEIDHTAMLNALLGAGCVGGPGDIPESARAKDRGSPAGAFDAKFGGDTRVVQAGRRFGLQIRGVHPPEAARGLDQAAEFGQHFDASYRPLILRALENGQFVLAFRGWEGERESSWGWIRRACDDGVGFCGATIWSEQELESLRDDLLVRPAVQVYVVERITPHGEPAH